MDFDGVDVWMIKATKQQLCELPLSIGYIEGVRPYMVHKCESGEEVDFSEFRGAEDADYDQFLQY